MARETGFRAGPILNGIVAVAAILVSSSIAAQDRETRSAAACRSLAGVTVPASSISLPTSGARVVSAELVPASDGGAPEQQGAQLPPYPEHCKVMGAVNPADPGAMDINFQLNLPTQWNGQAVHFGGFGFGGRLRTGLEAMAGGHPDIPTPVARGYVTFVSDGRGSGGGMQFALNDENLRNWGSDGLKKVRDAVVALVVHHYGTAPQRTYFQGSSGGGREALKVVQRFPQDYDGVISNWPFTNFIPTVLGENVLMKIMYGGRGAWPNPEKVANLYDAVMAACDGLDGAVDGLISNVAACNHNFRVEHVRCTDGADSGDDCLSDPQIAFFRAMSEEVPFGFPVAGQRSFPKWPILEGGDARFNYHLGRTPQPAGQNDASMWNVSNGMIRFFITQDPEYDSLQFAPDMWRERILYVSDILDALDDDISAFEARGGKLIIMNGLSDMSSGPYMAITYYEQLVERFGADRLRQFVRLYSIPGNTHGNGPFRIGWDPLTALEDWVEQGAPPANPIIVDIEPATAGRSRPLCEYPSWPKYRGAGGINVAASFECAIE